MTFLITPSDDILQVDVYDSIEQIPNMIEWQDMFEGKSTILDECGNTYIWDTSKNDEYGTVYGYTLTANGTNFDLLRQCKATYERLGKVDEFELTKLK